jgi:hypothetical protein
MRLEKTDHRHRCLLRAASGQVAAPPSSVMNSRRFKWLIRMCPPFEDRAASYPKWCTAVRGSATYFAVHQETQGISPPGTWRLSLRCTKISTRLEVLRT